MLTTRPAVRRAFTSSLGPLLVALLTASAATASAAEAQDSERHVGEAALYGSGLLVGSTVTPLPSEPVDSFVVADLDSGEIIAAQNAHVQAPPASTLKMLTALTVLPQVDLDAIYTATFEDVNVAGSKVGIVEGSTYTARQLFEGVFLISGNDAANAVAGLNGGIDSTVEQMQAMAGRLRAYDTKVANPNGLDAARQVSSAYDLALIARAGMQRDDFAEFAGMSNSTFPEEGTSDPLTRPTFEIWNQNELVTGGFEGGIGVKSGFTTQAGRTFAAAAERDGKRMLVTLMGIEGNTYRTGAAFLDWAFDNAESAEVVGTLVGTKLDSVPSDAAVLVSDKHSSDPAATSGRLPFYVLVVTLLACVLIWVQLRLQHRWAWGRRSPSGTEQPARSAEREEFRVRV